MRCATAVCFAFFVLAAVATAAPVVGRMADLATDTERMKHEVDEILESAKNEVSSTIPNSPPVHASSFIETEEISSSPLQQKVFASSEKQPGIFLEESATKPSALVEANSDGQVVSLAETGTMTQTEMAQQIASNEAAAPAKKSSVLDNQIEAIVGSKVVLESPKWQQAEENLDKSAGVVPAVDPDTNKMLDQFNQKYGVYDTLGVKNKAAQADTVPKDLLSDPNHPEKQIQDDDIIRDYKSIYKGANKWHFDPNLDNPESLDQMLGSMWAKRWEYFSTEKKKAEAYNSKTLVHRITPIFNEMYVEPTHDSSIGKIFTYALDKEKFAKNTIPNREHFAPKNFWYGPKVIDNAIDVSENKNGHGEGPSSPPKPGVQSFVYARYNDNAGKGNGPVYIESIQVTDRKNSPVAGVGTVEHMTTPLMVGDKKKLIHPKRAFINRKKSSI